MVGIPPSSIRALVVDDDSALRSFLMTVLRERGYAVEGEADGAEALEAFKRNRYDLMLVDLNLPGISGAELCRSVRALPEGEDPILICVTGHTGPEALTEVLDAGASDFLGKPLRLGLLETRLIIAERRLEEHRRRREVERALQESERRMEKIARNTPGMIFELSQDQSGALRFHFVSDGCRELFGLSEEDLLSDVRLLLGRLHPDDLARFHHTRRVSAERHIPWEWEGRSVRRLGSQWLQCAARPGVQPDGTVMWDGIFMDVTDRMDAARALRESRERLATTLDSVREGVLSVSTTGHVVMMNAVAERITRWSAEEVIGTPVERVLSLLDEVTQEAVALPLREVTALLLDVSMPQRTALRRRDGEVVPVAVNLAPMQHSGEVMGTVIVVQDLSETRRVREALQRYERDFKLVIEHVPDGVAILRGEVVVYANLAFVEMLRVERAEQLTGTSIADHVAEQEAPQLLGWLWRDGELSRAKTLELTFLRGDGRPILLELSAPQPIQFEDQASQLIVTRDITERREIQAQLLLADRLVSVGTLAAGITHEINNPLSYILANLSYLSEELEVIQPRLSPEEAADLGSLLGSARRGAERVAHIVNDVRTFSRADDSTVTLVDVMKVLELSLSIAKNAIRHRAQVVVEGGWVPHVAGNEGQLGQVFLNLLINAAHAIPEAQEGGQITVTVGTSGEGRAQVSIRDNGSGMSEQVRSRIFDPFFTTKPVGVGTGLGLSICHGIVVSMGGTIEVESQPCVGTCFRLSFPPALGVLAEEVRPAPSVEPPRLEEMRGGRVLVIDDEPDITEVVSRMLSQHTVETIHSGQAAIDRLLLGEPDIEVVLCDLQMPHITGMDIYEAVHAERPALAERFVFITGGAFTPRASQFMDRFAHRTLKKPFDLLDLQDTVALRLRALRAELGG